MSKLLTRLARLESVLGASSCRCGEPEKGLSVYVREGEQPRLRPMDQAEVDYRCPQHQRPLRLLVVHLRDFGDDEGRVPAARVRDAEGFNVIALRWGAWPITHEEQRQ